MNKIAPWFLSTLALFSILYAIYAGIHLKDPNTGIAYIALAVSLISRATSFDTNRQLNRIERYSSQMNKKIQKWNRHQQNSYQCIHNIYS